MRVLGYTITKREHIAKYGRNKVQWSYLQHHPFPQSSKPEPQTRSGSTSRRAASFECSRRNWRAYSRPSGSALEASIGSETAESARANGIRSVEKCILNIFVDLNTIWQKERLEIQTAYGIQESSKRATIESNNRRRNQRSAPNFFISPRKPWCPDFTLASNPHSTCAPS